MEFAPLAKGIALPQGLDLDHLGTELAEQTRSERCSDEGSDFDDADSAQSSHGGSLDMPWNLHQD